MIHGRTGTGGGVDYYSMITGWSHRNPFIETNASDFITNLVKAGLGIGIRSPVGILQDLKANHIAFVPITDPQVRASYLTLHTNPQRALSIAGAVLFERFKEALPLFAARIAGLVAERADVAGTATPQAEQVDSANASPRQT
jgi:DNA-binding transcriptional LysR family regulator